MQQTEIFPPRFFFFHLVHKEKLLRLLEGGKTRDNNKDLDITEGV